MEENKNKICKNCKFWSKEKQHERYDKIMIPFDPVTYDDLTEEETINLFGYLAGYCVNDKIVFFQRPEINGAAVCDGSEYKACLITGEKFGCVLWEENKDIIASSEGQEV